MAIRVRSDLRDLPHFIGFFMPEGVYEGQH